LGSLNLSILSTRVRDGAALRCAGADAAVHLAMVADIDRQRYVIQVKGDCI
jgi:hypothetical protein